MKNKNRIWNYTLSAMIIFLMSLSFSSKSIAQESSTTVKDIDGNVYNTVVIGTQIWMKENLKTTKYNDGTAIPNVTDNTEWENLTTGAYCWYDNDNSYKNPYGALYNWYAVETGKLCPEGWHVSSSFDWIKLKFFLGGNTDFIIGNTPPGKPEGGKLKETGTSHWKAPNTGATNETGFSALPGGWRENDRFKYFGTAGYWWGDGDAGQATWEALGRIMKYDNKEVWRLYNPKRSGLSVRCIKDEPDQ